MSSTVRDFQTRPARAATVASGQNSPSPRISPITTRQMTAPQVAGQGRPSISSIPESMTSALLKKRMVRSATVRTYHNPDRPNWQPGAEPGLDPNKEESDDDPDQTNVFERCEITITDYSEDNFVTKEADNFSLKDALSEPRENPAATRWISVNGLSWDVVKVLANKYNLHRLAIEDLMYTKSRTKVDWYSDHAFMILTLQTLVRVCSHDPQEDCGCDVHAQTNGAVTHAEDASGQSFHARWWPPFKSRRASKTVLPKHSDTLSTDIPTRKIRTLHRYESTRNPEYTEFMEKHSALADENLVVSVEQVAIFLMANNTVISFFEHSADVVEEPIMKRLSSQETILRRSSDASLLVQAIIDTIVDLALPVKDAYNKVRREMQIDVLTNPDIETSKTLYIFSEEVDMLQDLFKPIVNLVNALRDHQSDSLQPNATYIHSDHLDQSQTGVGVEGDPSLNRNSPEMRRRPLRRTQTSTSVVITPLTHTYLGDVLDHCLTHIRSLEQMDTSATNLASLIFNTVGAKTNNFMMILALVTVFFSPLTFISGYFGMNFESFAAIHEHSDAFFWAVSLPAVAVFMAAVGGNVIWSAIKSSFVKTKIKALRRERNKRRAATFGILGRKRGSAPPWKASSNENGKRKFSWQAAHSPTNDQSANR